MPRSSLVPAVFSASLRTSTHHIFIKEGPGERDAPNDESQELIDNPFGIRIGADLE